MSLYYYVNFFVGGGDILVGVILTGWVKDTLPLSATNRYLTGSSYHVTLNMIILNQLYTTYTTGHHTV